ncbi:SusF/SusE family outer membrane protein [Marinimicrobium sp. C6131]|uniref:SusF/SusE family outer membrane protein n=1 Tax=Marinimicrobium sp. C6131 TaxID=3022676 RepID=UPI00223D9F7E|nr:SusF/SusE family outer membrane protein [Marinimicrobium sp. C6131]UZJ44150.1 SusF/SusE family outer membrane protein [Marinimicrobium sp. C6131]
MNLYHFLTANTLRTWLFALTLGGLPMMMTACGGETQTGPDLPPLPEQEQNDDQTPGNDDSDDGSANTDVDPLYMVGSATPGGWSLDNKEALQPQSDNEAVYQWQGELGTGEIKFAHYEATDFCGGAWLLASSEAEPVSLDGSGNAYTWTEDCPDETGVSDWKWTVETAGVYEIRVNTDEERVYFALEEADNNTEEPGESGVHLFLVGDATPGGWSLDDATMMDRGADNTRQYTVTLELTSGSFKIAMAESASELSFDPGHDWIHPNTEGQPLAETAYSIVTAGEGEDYKWQISEDAAGTYDIAVDLEAETILIDPQ